MIITLDYFNQHMNDFNSDSDDLKTDCIMSAQEEIETYLGYSIDPAQYTFDGYSISDYQIALDSPIDDPTKLTVKVDGSIVTDYRPKFNFILFPASIRNKKLSITWQGGFSVVPASMKLAAAEIATIKFENRNKQITISAKQVPDGVMWSRVNHNNFDFILKSLDRYKL